MKNKTSKNTSDFEIIGWVLSYMITLKPHQLRQMTVDRLARELNMSRAYLYDLFKTYKIISPGWFLKMIKIIRASELLKKKPGLPVKTVSKKIGFNTVDYFIRVFKKFFGTTPLKLKKHYQKERSGGDGSFPGGK